MKKSIKAFLNPIAMENKEVIISNRFKDEEGKDVPWEIKAIAQTENDMLLKKHLKRDKKGNETFDRTAYMTSLTCASVVYPDLKDAELQQAYGVMGEEALLKKMLTVGEYANLVTEVQNLSELESEEDLIEEAKN